MLDRIEYVHSKGILHLNIKPKNFVMGLGTWSHEVVCIIDFGLAVEYWDPSTHHETRALGTIRYASLNEMT